RVRTTESRRLTMAAPCQSVAIQTGPPERVAASRSGVGAGAGSNPPEPPQPTTKTVATAKNGLRGIGGPSANYRDPCGGVDLDRNRLRRLRDDQHLVLHGFTLGAGGRSPGSSHHIELAGDRA